MKKTALLTSDIADKLNIPPELHAKAARLSIIAGCRALVESRCVILEYSEERIVLMSGRSKIVFLGSNLTISAMNRSELLICGKIKSLEWE